MAQVFRDQCRDVYRHRGAWGVLWVWFPMLIDLAVTLAEEHRQKGFQMSNDTLTRYSGSLLMLGGLSWAFAGVSQLQPGSHYNFQGIYMLSFMLYIPAMLLCGVGLLGLRSRYNTALGPVGKLTLTLAIIGGIAGGISFFIMPFLGEAGWGMFMLGILLHYLSLIAFGLTTLRSRALPIGNWLPILMGAMPLLSFAFSAVIYEGEVFGPLWPEFVLMVVGGVAWIALGYGIHTDRPKEQAAPV
jgi:hypothetical protein